MEQRTKPMNVPIVKVDLWEETKSTPSSPKDQRKAHRKGVTELSQSVAMLLDMHQLVDSSVNSSSNEEVNEETKPSAGSRYRKYSWTAGTTPPKSSKVRRSSLGPWLEEGASGNKGRSGSASNLLAAVLSKTLRIKRTKSRSVDQSLAAAFDVDVIGGLSRLAGSALGGSADSGAGGGLGRPVSPVGILGSSGGGGGGGGERRSSGGGSSSSVGGSTSRLAEDTLAYTVKSSDTLTSLAARFDTTPSELVAINKLSSRLIFPGQVLQVPIKGNGGGGSGAGGGGEQEDATAKLGTSPNSTLSPALSVSVNDVTTQGPVSPSEKSEDHAFLASLRPPGSPRFNRSTDSTTSSALSPTPSELANEDYSGADMDIEAERAKDRAAYEKFLKIHVRHITDGQGVVAGVLLVTPNTVMFDPNVSDALVIEHGAEAYGVIAPMEFVVNAALYPDIAHMRLAEQHNGLPDQPISDPIYYPSDCPLHRKYAALEERASKEKEGGEVDAAAGILAIASDIQRRWSEGDDTTHASAPTPPAVSLEPSTKSISPTPTPNPTPTHVAAPCSLSPTPTPNPTPMPTPKSETADLTDKAQEAQNSPRLPAKTLNELTSRSELSKSVSNDGSITSVPVASSMDKTPSGDREDELCYSEDMNVTDDDVQDEAFHSSSSCFEQAISEAMVDEDEFRPRHLSAGAVSPAAHTAAISHQQHSGRNRTMHSSLYRHPRHAPGSDSGTGRSQSSSPAQSSSSPESRGQRMLKRLSYPLVWMGESLSGESKENSPVLIADKDPNAESVFSKVFSRRLSTENSLKLDSRLVPNLFRGKEPQQQQPTNLPAAKSADGAQQPKLGYRSMVSVDDVPELFASLDKLIPKPAQPNDTPPLYLRLRMGKPLNRKAGMSTPIMAYGKKKMKPEYWFSIPREKADSLCRFFLLWAPGVYGDLGDVETVAKKGFELITRDLEWDDQPIVRRPKQPSASSNKKAKSAMLGKKNSGDSGSGEDDDDPLGVTAELAKESWEIVSLNEEVRRALYQERLSNIDFEQFLPDLIGQTEVLTDEYRKQLAKHLPARVEGYPWTLVFSTSQHGFSLGNLYRKMAGIDSPILLVIEDTQGNVFGALTSCELRVSESFYGTGESFLFVMNPKLQIYSWTGENSYFIQGNNESLAIGAGDGRFGLWLDGDLNQGRTQTCKTFGNEPLSPDEDFWVRTLECWAFM